ncbi:hypothetical protein NC652_000137 [Populus alba x Populus x berolinensis]|nr:hypothetical protein NC652_000137 [Populus alba x Populus x berolinensis]
MEGRERLKEEYVIRRKRINDRSVMEKASFKGIERIKIMAFVTMDLLLVLKLLRRRRVQQASLKLFESRYRFGKIMAS